MKNKMIILILGLLFVVFLVLALLGFFKKNNNEEKPVTDYPSSVERITYNDIEMNIVSLQEKIDSFDFVRANKEFESGYLKVYINNDEIKVDIIKTGITNSTEEMPETITYTVKDVISPVAVQAQMLSNDANLLKIYSLDKNGKLFVSVLNANPQYYSGIKTYMYEIDNVVSFTTLTIPLYSTVKEEQCYTIFKTKDDDYYTDYVFNYGLENVLTKIHSVTEEQVTNNSSGKGY